jgi:Fe-S-cluster containining protein
MPQSFPAFQVCGCAGLVFAVILTMGLVVFVGLSVWVMAAITVAAVVTFLGLVMATKIITGKEQLICYHHEIAVMAATALLLRLLHQPVLPYLDVTILGVGTFLAFGRVGCLMVGCCHGRPHKWGVRYREGHVFAGFTPHFVGVRLFPIQAVESLWVLGTVVAGCIFVLKGSPEGTAFAWYIIIYSAGRFCFEFLRGDSARSYHWGFSEAQWFSLLLMSAVVGLELSGALPFYQWHLALTGGFLITSLGIVLKRNLQDSYDYRLLLPQHVKEVVAAHEQVCHLSAASQTKATNDGQRPGIPLVCTSLGLRLSLGGLGNGADKVIHYALSFQNRTMTEKTARKLADLILKLKYPDGCGKLLKGDHAVFHLLVYPKGHDNGRKLPTPAGPEAFSDIHPDFRREVVSGFLYTHDRLNANTELIVKAGSRLTALADLLIEKGIVTGEEVERRGGVACQELSKQLQDQGIGMIIQDSVPDKYALNDLAKVDCSKRIHICHAACCRLAFALSSQDVADGIHWDLGWPYMIAKKDNGCCQHLDRKSWTCTVYDRRPSICRTYSCEHDKRIWADYEKMILNFKFFDNSRFKASQVERERK